MRELAHAPSERPAFPLISLITRRRERLAESLALNEFWKGEGRRAADCEVFASLLALFSDA